jgi:metal-responsive CopG/Arc/MetJ family transcriptional regulator
MNMKRKRIAMTISLPPETAQAYERLARQKAKNRSQLFRDMFQLYQEQALEEEFSKLQRYGSKIAKKKGVITEKDVERLVFEGR